MRLLFLGSLFLSVAMLSACTSSHKSEKWTWDKPSPKRSVAKGNPHFKVGRPYTVKGKRYYPKEKYSHSEVGIASWYGPGFHGRLTANGEVFDMNKISAAHKTLQLPCMVKVTNLRNNRVLIVRVNDRGPYHQNRVIDLSKRAAHELGILQRGTARVRVEVLPDQSRKLTRLARQGYFPEQPDRHHYRQEAAIKLARKPAHIRDFYPYVAKSQFSVTIKGIASPERALDYQDQLTKVGKVGIKECLVNGKRTFNLHIGPYQNKQEAIKVAGYLENMGHGVDILRVQ